MLKRSVNYIIEHIIDITLVLILLFYIFSCITFTINNPEYKCLGSMLVFIVIYYLIFKVLLKVQVKSEKVLRLTIFLVPFCIYLVWNYYAKIPLVSDYKVLYEGALEFVKGNFRDLTFDKHNYFYWWNFQIGYSLYLGLIMKVIGTKIFSLKITEALYLSATNYLIYLIMNKISTKKIALLSTTIYSSFLFIILGCGVINNQHSGFFFATLGIYFFTKNKSIKNMILCGICLAISYILRQTVIVILISFIVYYIWLITKDKKMVLKESLVCIIILVCSFLIFTKGYDFTLKKIDLVPKSALKSNTKYYKFALGIDWYYPVHGKSHSDLEYYNWDYELYNKKSLEYIINNYKYHFFDKVLPFQFEKMIVFAGDRDNQIIYTGDFSKNATIPRVLSFFGYAQYFLVIILSLLTICYFYKFNKFNKFLNFYKISFILFFLVYILIEVQSRYRYEQYIVLAIMSSPFLLVIFNYLDKINSKIRKTIKQKNILS